MRPSAVVVERNALMASLLSEKLACHDIETRSATTLDDALNPEIRSSSVIWSFVWPHQRDELLGLEHYTSRARILVLGSNCSPAVQTRMLLMGCRGYVDAGEGLEVLAAAVAKVSRGGHRFNDVVLSSSIDALLEMRNSATLEVSLLTAREEQIAAQVVRGASNKEIAISLSLSESTVKSHLQRIFAKLGVGSRLALALHILQHPRPDVACAASDEAEPRGIDEVPLAG